MTPGTIVDKKTFSFVDYFQPEALPHGIDEKLISGCRLQSELIQIYYSTLLKKRKDLY